jgi:hypothetical protein
MKFPFVSRTKYEEVLERLKVSEQRFDNAIGHIYSRDDQISIERSAFEAMNDNLRALLERK